MQNNTSSAIIFGHHDEKSSYTRSYMCTYLYAIKSWVLEQSVTVFLWKMENIAGLFPEDQLLEAYTAL